MDFLLVMFRVCRAFLFVHCNLVVTCWESAYILALLNVMFLCFYHYPMGVLVQLSFLIVSIPDLCFIHYF